MLYYWLATNIVLFYIFIAYGISLWGAYLCWAQEEEESLVREAMTDKLKNLVEQAAIEQDKKEAVMMIKDDQANNA